MVYTLLYTFMVPLQPNQLSLDITYRYLTLILYLIKIVAAITLSIIYTIVKCHLHTYWSVTTLVERLIRSTFQGRFEPKNISELPGRVYISIQTRQIDEHRKEVYAHCSAGGKVISRYLEKNPKGSGPNIEVYRCYWSFIENRFNQ